jgi:hypothetical protein
VSQITDSKTDSLRRRRPAIWLAVAAGVVLLLGGGYWAVHYWRSRANKPGVARIPPPDDPRLTYDGPFQNVRPDVAYVGSTRCADCHEREASSYARHPMGRSILPIARIADSQRYDTSVNNPFDALDTQFLVTKQDGRVFHRQIGRDEKGAAVYEADMPVDYVIGSGSRGYSYLLDREGYVLQSPVSWFSQKGIWDKSPGFANSVRAGRPVIPSCLFCHANRARPIDGYVNRYEQPVFEGTAIGCERCHGPGSRHVQDPGSRNAAGIDPTIVNPRHLSFELRAAVCEQCHLEGEARVPRRGRDLYDFRPGLPLQGFWSVFVQAADPEEPRKAVNHVEQMYMSACFAHSVDDPATGQRKLGCTSCHDPHVHVAGPERTPYYRQACLKCHEQRGCSVPETTRRKTVPDDSCIACHMPRYRPTDVAHVASTDHRILRRPENVAHSDRANAELKFVPFHADAGRPDPAERDREMGIAIADYLFPLVTRGQPVSDRVGRQAIRLLEKAIQNDTSDIMALERRASLLALFDRPEDAAEAYEELLARHPNRELALLGAGMVAQYQRQWDKALAYFRHAVVENPWEPNYRAVLTQLLVRNREWDEALSQAREWLRIDPASIDARAMVARCLGEKGDKAAAREEFDRIEQLRPPNLQDLRKQFNRILEKR